MIEGGEAAMATSDAANAAVPADEIAGFVSRVVPWPHDGPGVINLHYTSPKGPGMRGQPFTHLEDFMQRTGWCATHEAYARDVYFCLSLQAKVGKVYRGGTTAARHASDALLLKAIWLDIDVKPDKGYPTKEDALCALDKFVKDAALPFPTAIVDSGNGFHVYWISNKPLTKAEWAPYAGGLWGAVLKFGLKCDPVTTDAARILRAPGTWNRKNVSEAPRLVSVKWLDPTDYDFAVQLRELPVHGKDATVTAPVTSNVLPFDLSRFAGKRMAMAFAAAGLDPQRDSLAEGIAGRDDRPLDPSEVFQGCKHFADSFQQHGAGQSQGLWMLTVLASSFFENGQRIAHTLSRGYPTYSKAETDAMYDRKVNERAERGLGWPSCKAIENEGCKLCATCVHKGKIRSPLNLASRTAPLAAENVTEQVKSGTILPVAAIRTLYKGGAGKETLFAALNETYAVVRYGSEVLIASIIGRDVLTMEPEDFHKMFGNVRIGDGERSVEVSRLWLKWRDRRQYLGRGVVFEPGGPLEVADDMLNLWRGFGIEAKQGDWPLMRDHIINVVCSGQQEHFDYLIRWMAYAVQHPKEPIGVAVAFRGAQGAGKGIVARTFGRFFGKHFAHIANGEQLTGRFNASLATSCAVFLDEALWAGDKKGEGVLKALITEPRLQLEAKFRDPIMVENRLRIMVASNNDWCVPAGIGDRRWFILDVANTFAGTMHRGYWDALYAEIENGGAAAMFHDLLAMDLSGFDVRAVPHTAAKAQQQAHSLHGTEAWLYHVLQEGSIGCEHWQDNTGLTVSKDQAYLCFEDFSKQQRAWRPEIKDLWSKKIRAVLGPCVADTRPKHVRSFQFAPLADCRRRFEIHAGAPNFEWEPDSDPEHPVRARQAAHDAGLPTAMLDAADLEGEWLSEPGDAGRQPVGKLESRPAIPEVFQRGINQAAIDRALVMRK